MHALSFQPVLSISQKGTHFVHLHFLKDKHMKHFQLFLSWFLPSLRWEPCHLPATCPQQRDCGQHGIRGLHRDYTPLDVCQVSLSFFGIGKVKKRELFYTSCRKGSARSRGRNRYTRRDRSWCHSAVAQDKTAGVKAPQLRPLSLGATPHR